MFRFASAVLCAALLAVTTLAPAALPVDPRGRDVLLDLRTEPERADAELLAARSRTEAVFTFEATEDQLAQDRLFALHIGLAPGDAAPAVLLNGRPMVHDPFRRGDGVLFRLSPAALKSGTNTLILKAPGGETVRATSATIFSLLDTFEEVHFAQAFMPRGSFEKAQPAPHPDQLRIDVLSYDLEIELDMNSTFVDGSLDVTFAATDNNVSQLVLDFEDNNGAMTASSVQLAPSFQPVPFSQSGGRLFVTLPLLLQTGEQATVRIDYAGTPDPSAGAFGVRAFVRSTTTSGDPLIYTFSEPYNARAWWPCKDLPDDKAMIDIAVIAPAAYTPVTNGILQSVQDVGSGRLRHAYSHSYPVATYLISITCTDFEYGSGIYTALDNTTEMEVGHYVWPNSTAELAAVPNTIRIMEFFAETFGEYPFLSERYVTATWGAGFGMEHQTATSINNGDLLSDAAGPGLSRRNIHELAHSWFGNLVTMNTFDHLWLNEGWATYCEALFREYDEGTAAYFAEINNFESRGISNTVALVSPQADAFAGSVVYRRGGFVLHMLRKVMGDTAFFEGTRDYLETHAYGTVLTEDFETAMEGTHGESLDWFFDQWVYEAGRPSYTWSWTEENNGGVRVQIDQTQTGAVNVYRMPIDLHLVREDGTTDIVTVLNTQRSQPFFIGSPDPSPVTDVLFDPQNWVLKTATEIVPPSAPAPVILGAETGGRSVVVNWDTGGGSTSSFALQASSDGTAWTQVAQPAAALREHTISLDTLPPSPSGDNWWENGLHLRLRAMSVTEAPSEWTDVYSARPALTGAPGRVLIVDGYDRNKTANPQPHPWAVRHAEALAAYGVAYDTVANERITSDVELADYEAVVWIAAEESTADETFSTFEQNEVRSYLEQGGALLVTGAEIGWDLDWRGEAADKAFYNNVLKADYVADDSGGDMTVSGTPLSAFAGLAFTFGNGTDDSYFVQWPDVIATSGLSSEALIYSPGNAAAVQYTGTLPGGTAPARVITTGFPFETIIGETSRNAFMAAAMQYLGIEPQQTEPGDLMLMR